jgi:hypothetical protein
MDPPEQVTEGLTEPVIREKLVDTEVDPECLQVLAILNGILDFPMKLCLILSSAARTCLLSCLVFCDKDLQERDIMDLPAFHFERFHQIQRGPTFLVFGNSLNPD